MILLLYLTMVERHPLNILTELNVETGVYMTKLCDELDRRRKSLSFCKSTEDSKKRKTISVPGKKQKDQNIESEGVSYKAGGF